MPTTRQRAPFGKEKFRPGEGHELEFVGCFLFSFLVFLGVLLVSFVGFYVFSMFCCGFLVLVSIFGCFLPLGIFAGDPFFFFRRFFGVVLVW